MVRQKSRKCSASFVADIAESVAKVARVFWTFSKMSEKT
jgi:hypothetical protein